MARGSHDHENRAGMFFMATLVMWGISVFFEILFNRRTELVSILSGFVFFQSANWFIRNWVSRDPLFVNTCVLSPPFLHYLCFRVSWFIQPPSSTIDDAQTACTRCLKLVFILVNQWTKKGLNEMFEHSTLVGYTWPWAYPALCFSSGYFAYDQLDMLLYHLYSGWIPSILLHHLVLLVCFTLALYRNVTINYLILTLICELNSVLLHVRKLRRMAGVRDAKSSVVKAEWVLNLLTFVVARFASHVLITVKLVRDAHKFDKGVELPLALLGMAAMNLLNIFLGLDLFHAYRRENNPPKNNSE